MKLNSINKINFKSIYVALGPSSAQSNFKKRCNLQSSQMACVSVKKDDLSLIKNTKTKDLIDRYISPDDKVSIVIDGHDLKRYKNKEDISQNKTDLLKKACGIIFLPLFNDK